jgi:DNA (cytosine-5)-methyltransferase 1
MLACLNDLGYLVEWRVVNAADYGFPQRRRRVFIVAMHLDQLERDVPQPLAWMLRDGVVARALPAVERDANTVLPLYGDLTIEGDLAAISEHFGNAKASPFRNAGVAWQRAVWTRELTPAYDGPRTVLGDVLQPEDEVPEQFFIPESQLATWKYLKGAKRELRTHRASGTTYYYTEGPVAFPDRLDQPSRTILTGEGGASASRFKHVIRAPSGRLRRLTPLELERLDGFPDNWTEGLPDARRAFATGNALVVNLVGTIGRSLRRECIMDSTVTPSRMASEGVAL